MRILQVVHNYPPEFRGGVERSVENASEGLRALGHEVVIAAGSERRAESPQLEREVTSESGLTKRFRLVKGPGLFHPVDCGNPGLTVHYEQVLAETKPDLVHVHHWWNLGDDLVRRARRRGHPVVVTLHDFTTTCSLLFRMPDGVVPCDLAQNPENCGPCLAKHLGYPEGELAFRVRIRKQAFLAELQSAQLILAPSKSHAEALEEYWDGEISVEALPLGTPTIPGLNASAPASAVQSGTPLRVLHFGNLSSLKGVDLLLEAVRSVDPERKLIHLTIAGSSPHEAFDFTQVKHIPDYDFSTLQELASSADIAVFPSRARETYGLVVDEALRLGLPVLVSDGSALSERIGERGMTFTSGDVESLSAALRLFLDTPEALARLKAAPMPPLLSPDEHARRLEEIYKQLTVSPGASKAEKLDVETALLQRLDHLYGMLPKLLSSNASHSEPQHEKGETLNSAESLAAPLSSADGVVVDPSGEWVSVITRTRNRPEMLREAVESVAAQTWPKVELVVCNDGGVDVADVLAPFRDRLAITYLDPGGVGRCQAANRALENARGQWIAWLDDDDLFFPEHLQVLMEEAKKTQAKVLYTDAYELRMGRLKADEPYREISRSVPYSEDFTRVGFFRRSYIHLVTVLHHRECFERLGGFDPSLEVLEDLDMFFRYAQDWDFQHIPKVTSAFRIRDDDTNAVTALRHEFAETRTKLYQRYAHIGLPEMISLLQSGEGQLASMAREMEHLKAEVANLKSRISS